MDNRYATTYRNLYENHWWWRAREHAVLKTIESLSFPGGLNRILDVGCGDALLFDRLRELGDIEGVENDSSLVSPEGKWRDKIHIGPFDRTFQPSKKYDLILMLDVLEHLPDAPGALRLALDLMNEGGNLLITVPAFRSLWTTHDDLNHHFTRYTRKTLRQACDQAGTDVALMRYFFHWTCPIKLAIRLKEAVIPTTPKPPSLPATMVNRFFYGLSRLEQLATPWMSLPFGSSLLGVIQK